MKLKYLYICLLLVCCGEHRISSKWFSESIPSKKLYDKLELNHWNSITKLSDDDNQIESKILKDRLIINTSDSVESAFINIRNEFLEMIRDSIDPKLEINGLVIKESFEEGAKIQIMYILYIVKDKEVNVKYYVYTPEAWELRKTFFISPEKLFNSLDETIFKNKNNLKSANNQQSKKNYCLNIFTSQNEYSFIHFDNNFILE